MSGRLPPTVAGIGLMLLATVCFSTMHTCIRMAAADPGNPIDPLELAFFRNFFGVVTLLPVLFRAGPSILRTNRLGLHFCRSVIQSAGMICFFFGITMIPLAEVTALSFSAPLFATALAIVVLGERVRIRRLTALVLGFSGVIVVLRPGFDAVSLGALCILGASATWAVAMTIIKSLATTESSVTSTLYAGLFMAPITLVPALFVWTTPTLEQFGWLLAVGAAGSVGHVLFAQAFKLAEMSAVLPLDFLRLVWASVAGYALFAETPSAFTWLGGLLIFAAATYIALREAQLARIARVETETKAA